MLDDARRLQEQGNDLNVKRARLGPRSLTKINAKRVVVDADTIFEPGFVVIANGKIAECGNDESVSTLASLCEATLNAHTVTPGFVDIHTHGIGGADEIGDFWRVPEYTLNRVVKYGTTSVLASMVFPLGTSSLARIHSIGKSSFCRLGAENTCTCEGIAPKCTEDVFEIAAKLNSVVGKSGLGAVLEGIHAEGPIVATLGGLPACDTAMSNESFEQLLDALGPALKVMTIAPSVEARSTPPFEKTRMLLARGVRPALGHDTVCTPEDIAAALKVDTPDKMPLHVTHALNVQRFHHRDCGLANVALLSRLPKTETFAGVEAAPTAEVIGDCTHVSPLVLQLAVSSKPVGTLCFVTDGIAEPLPGLELTYAGRKATVVFKDGRPAVYSTSAEHGKEVLVGSCVMMFDAFKTAVQVLDVGLPRAVDLCCCTPAKVAGLCNVGSLKPGKRADLILFDDKLGIRSVFVAGAVAFDCEKMADLDQPLRS